MYVLEAGTIASEVNIFEEAEKTVERNERFLRKAANFASMSRSGVSVVGISLPNNALPIDRAVRIQFKDGKWVDVFAQVDTVSIRRSCGFHFARPWHPYEDSFSHVRKAILGFLRK